VFRNSRRGAIAAAAVAMLLCFCLRAAADITVVGPSDPIEAGSYAFIQVQGLSQPDLVKATVKIEPSGPLLMPLQDWSGKPMLFFSSQKQGSYTVSVSLNAWATVVDESYTTVKSAPIEPQDEELRKSYLNSAAALTAAYRADIGKCVIQVGEPTPPPPPPPPPSEKITGLLFYDADQLDNQPDFAKLVVSTRIRQIPKFTFTPFDYQPKNENNQVPSDLAPWIKLIEDQKWGYPCMLLINENGDLVGHGSPKTVDEAINLVKEVLP